MMLRCAYNPYILQHFNPKMEMHRLKIHVNCMLTSQNREQTQIRIIWSAKKIIFSEVTRSSRHFLFNVWIYIVNVYFSPTRIKNYFHLYTQFTIFVSSPYECEYSKFSFSAYCATVNVVCFIFYSFSLHLSMIFQLLCAFFFLLCSHVSYICFTSLFY